MIQDASLLEAERVRETLAHVLQRREFQSEKSLLESILEWLLPRLGPERISFLGELLTWLLAALLLFLVLRLAWQLLRRPRAAPEAPLPAGPPPAELVRRLTSLERAAEHARAAGELRLALRLYFLALLLALGGRGDLVYRDSWTNRELLRRGNPSPAVRGVLEELVRELEGKDFGRDEVREQDLERLAGLLAGALRRSPGVA